MGFSPQPPQGGTHSAAAHPFTFYNTVKMPPHRTSLNSKRFTKIAARSCFLTRDIGRYTDFGAEGGGYAGRFAPTKTFTFRVPLPKQLKYANPADNYPSNTSMPWIAIGFSYTNGAAASAQAPLRAETSVSFAFTDTM